MPDAGKNGGGGDMGRMGKAWEAWKKGESAESTGEIANPVVLVGLLWKKTEKHGIWGGATHDDVSWPWEKYAHRRIRQDVAQSLGENSLFLAAVLR